MMSASPPWPPGCRGALSLTFDDGLPSQLRVAAPMMNDLGLKGTFYLCPRGNDWQKSMERWRPVYEAGHEIGNHSMSHTCSRAFSDDPAAQGLETMTLAEIEADVTEAERRLSELFPAEQRSFAYPCFQSHVGEGETRQSYVPVIARRFIAARAWGELPNAAATCDLHHLWSWMVRGHHGPHLVGLAEQCAAQGRWGILTFHGIHEGHLPVADVDFRELCTHLAQAEHIWVAPVAEVAAAIKAWRAESKGSGR
jgi:hypothetical protein